LGRLRAEEINQVADNPVNRAQVRPNDRVDQPIGCVNTMSLQVVIQMRQVNQIERRLIFFLNPFR
jgi:hypothetical protein